MLLITGGLGYIGSHTAVEALRAGSQVVIVDNLVNSRRNVLHGIHEAAAASVYFFEGDCRDATVLDTIFAQYTITSVIHFAALKAVRESFDRPLEYYQNNIEGLLTVLAAMRRHGVRDLVFSSSAAVYGSPAELPVAETHPLSLMNSPYGFTKIVGEKIIGDFVKANASMRAVVLRYFNPIGADSSGAIGEYPQGIPNNLVPYIIQVAARIRDKLTVYGSDYDTPDGTCIRDFIHVSDLAGAHLKALSWMTQQPAGVVEVFNVGTGTGRSVLDLIVAFEAASGQPLTHDFGPRRSGDIAQLFADVAKIEAAIGWKAQRTVDDAMKSAWLWAKRLDQ
jgi:UDP-glucose 4-epimerase